MELNRGFKNRYRRKKVYNEEYWKLVHPCWYYAIITFTSISKEGKLQLAKASEETGKWAEGEFAFDNRDLKSVMQEIGSWYNISVVFHSRPLLEERIYFRMERVKEVKGVLQVLNDMGIAKFELVDKKIVVTDKKV